ncbi:hypothetical protein [Erythrobacter rubeus]|uniref:Uncharacterized protein n=1 Tax=Erythrobacter rubeus TaxID=2760803 RepID=A0ABR8KRX3_9SPHN|nr:hypothetical protein [Erythrobacter rubeus]MBD2843512.1 hypothetical protein [Erythrobacter rubeus]
MLSRDASGALLLTPCPSTSRALAELAEIAGTAAQHAHHSQQHDLANADQEANQKALGHTHDEGAPGMAEALCDQAALGTAMIPPRVLEIADQPPSINQGHSKVSQIIPGQGLAAPPPPSTGPPFLIA